MSQFFTSRLLNFVEPTIVNGIQYTSFYSTLNTNFNVGDRVFILNGVYDSDLLITQNKYAEGTDGYIVLAISNCFITLNIPYTGTSPYLDESYDQFIKVWNISGQTEFDYINKLYTNQYITGPVGKFEYGYTNNIIYTNGSLSGIGSGWGQNSGVTSSGIWARTGLTWSNINAIFNADSFSFSSTYLSTGFTNNDNLLILGEDFVYNGSIYEKDTVYYYSNAGEWEININYEQPIISKLNLRNGNFNGGTWNDGIFGTYLTNLTWTGTANWNSGFFINSNWLGGTINSKSSPSQQSFYTSEDQYGNITQTTDYSNNKGFGYNYFLNSDVFTASIIDGNFENCIIGNTFSGSSLVDDYLNGSYSVSVNTSGGYFYQDSEAHFTAFSASTVFNTTIDNSIGYSTKFLNSYADESVIESGSDFDSSSPIQILAADLWSYIPIANGISIPGPSSSGDIIYDANVRGVLKIYISQSDFDKLDISDTFYLTQINKNYIINSLTTDQKVFLPFEAKYILDTFYNNEIDPTNELMCSLSSAYDNTNSTAIYLNVRSIAPHNYITYNSFSNGNIAPSIDIDLGNYLAYYVFDNISAFGNNRTIYLNSNNLITTANGNSKVNPSATNVNQLFANQPVINSDFKTGIINNAEFSNSSYINYESNIISKTSSQNYLFITISGTNSISVYLPSTQSFNDNLLKIGRNIWLDSITYVNGTSSISVDSRYQISSLTTTSFYSIIDMIDQSPGTSSIAGLTSGGYFTDNPATSIFASIHPILIENSVVSGNFLRRGFFSYDTIYNQNFNNTDTSFMISNLNTFRIMNYILDDPNTTIESGMIFNSFVTDPNWENGIIYNSIWNGPQFQNGLSMGNYWINGVFDGGIFMNSNSIISSTPSYIANNGISPYSYTEQYLNWFDGIFNGGNFYNSSWFGGIFNNGQFYNSDFYGGVWNNGILGNSSFNSTDTTFGSLPWSGTGSSYSVWNNGQVNNAQIGGALNVDWYGGKFNNGIFTSGGISSYSNWWGGDFNGGLFTGAAQWMDGNFNNGYFYSNYGYVGGYYVIQFNPFAGFLVGDLITDLTTGLPIGTIQEINYPLRMITLFELTDNILTIGDSIGSPNGSSSASNIFAYSPYVSATQSNEWAWLSGTFSGGIFGNGNQWSNSTWYSGTFDGGIFQGKIWNNGVFYNGTFNGSGATTSRYFEENFNDPFLTEAVYGLWLDGWVLDAKSIATPNVKVSTQLVRSIDEVKQNPMSSLNNMLWQNGTFSHTFGIMNNSIWWQGIFQKGTFQNSSFNPYVDRGTGTGSFQLGTSSIWQNGILNNSNFYISQWQNGTFQNGTMSGAIWLNGIWDYGDANNIYWANGTWNNGNWNGSPFDYTDIDPITMTVLEGPAYYELLNVMQYNGMTDSIHFINAMTGSVGPELLGNPTFSTPSSITYWDQSGIANSWVFESVYGKFDGVIISAVPRNNAYSSAPTSKVLTAQTDTSSPYLFVAGNTYEISLTFIAQGATANILVMTGAQSANYTIPFIYIPGNPPPYPSLPKEYNYLTTFTYQYLCLSNFDTLSVQHINSGYSGGVNFLGGSVYEVNYYYDMGINNTIVNGLISGGEPSNISPSYGATISIPALILDAYDKAGDLISVNFGSGTMESGIFYFICYNNGYFNGGATLFDQFVGYIKVNPNTWNIEVSGSLHNFVVGDQVSIGNIVAFDINENFCLIKDILNVILVTTTSIVVQWTTSNTIIRRIQVDSTNHPIYVTDCIFYAAGIFNGLFENAVFSYVMMNSAGPYILGISDSCMIDGLFFGGHLVSNQETLADSSGMSFSYNSSLIQSMIFDDGNVGTTVSYYQYNSWIESVPLTSGGAVNISYNNQFFNSETNATITQNALYCYPSEDVLRSQSTFTILGTSSNPTQTNTYQMGLNYNLYTNFLGNNISQFNQYFDTNTTLGLSGFISNGWTSSGLTGWSFQSNNSPTTVSLLQITYSSNPIVNNVLDNSLSDIIQPQRYSIISFDVERYPSHTDAYLTTQVGYSTVPGILSNASDGINLIGLTNSIEYFFNRPSLSLNFVAGSSGADSLAIDNLYIYEVDQIPFICYVSSSASVNQNIVTPNVGSAPIVLGNNTYVNINNISISKSTFGQLNLVSQNLLPGNQINNRNTEGI